MSAASLRILAVTLRYPPYVAGGYELLTRDAVEGLRARGHDVHVLAGRGRRLEGVEQVAAVLEPDLDDALDPFERSFRTGNFGRFGLHVFSLANYRATARALRELEPDVLVFFNLGLVSLAPLVAARIARVPTLGYLADLWPKNHWLATWKPEERGKDLRYAALARMWRGFRALVGLGPMLAVSRYLANELEADGIDSHDLSVVHLGLPPEMQRAAEAGAPVARAPGDVLRVLCTSMHWEGKGVHVALQAAAGARRAGVELELSLAGDGPADYAARLRELAAVPELEGRVRFLGRLTRGQVAAELARAHVLLFPSLWGEPFAIAVLEAMAHGPCLVATAEGGTPEALEDGVSGLLVPAGDAEAMAAALVRLDGDEDLRRALAAAAGERVRERFGIEPFLDGVEAGIMRARALGPR